MITSTHKDYLITIETLHNGALQFAAIPDHGDTIRSTYYGYDQHDALSAFITLIDGEDV